MIVKNEQNYIREWIRFHSLSGFDCIIIYDNLSSDNTSSIIKREGSTTNVIYEKWDEESAHYQRLAYDHCLNNYGPSFDWIAFIDSDEFICSDSDLPIKTMLHQRNEAAAVALNWLIFGSSGHIKAPDGLVTQNYTRRSDVSFGPNRHVKSVVRPKRTKSCINPHVFDVDGVYSDVNGKEVSWEIPGLVAGTALASPIRINHYFTRSREDWQKKILRGYHDTSRLEEQFTSYDRNEVEDLSISHLCLRLGL